MAPPPTVHMHGADVASTIQITSELRSPMGTLVSQVCWDGQMFGKCQQFFLCNLYALYFFYLPHHVGYDLPYFVEKWEEDFLDLFWISGVRETFSLLSLGGIARLGFL